MIVIGLTGGIGMGKSTTAQFFADAGVPVWDADGAVHRLYAPKGAAVELVTARFGDVKDETGGIDRPALAQALMKDEAGFADLEAIVHPLVFSDRQAFLEIHKASGAPMVVCDIPLLFEGGGDAIVDVIVVVTAPEDVRRARVLARPGMTPQKYEAIVARQVSDADKRARADYIIHTDKGLEVAREAVFATLDDIGKTRPSVS